MFVSYDTDPRTDPEAISVRPQRECLFFESTEELYKFKIKDPETNAYLRENMDTKLVYKDGEDKGTVFFFEKHGKVRIC